MRTMLESRTCTMTAALVTGAMMLLSAAAAPALADGVTLSLDPSQSGNSPMLAQATAPQPETSRAGLIPAGSSPYAEGNFQLSFYGGAIAETFGGRASVLTFGAVGMEYFFIDNLSALVEPIGYGITHDGADSTAGGGLNIGLRWHALRFDDDRIAVYWEGLMGYVRFADRAPGPTGTHSNFTLWTGPGVKWRITDSVSLIGGARYFHMSNARRRGKGRNPAMDGFGGYAGLTVHF